MKKRLMKTLVVVVLLGGVIFFITLPNQDIQDGESSAGVSEELGSVQEEIVVEEEPIEEVLEGKVTQEEMLVNGKTLDERISEAIKDLHAPDSAHRAREHFPDLELVYSDFAEGEDFPSDILPFEYYYSEEADKTFSLCAIERTVFICEGKVTRKVTDAEMSDPEICIVTPIYAEYF